MTELVSVPERVVDWPNVPVPALTDRVVGVSITALACDVWAGRSRRCRRSVTVTGSGLAFWLHMRMLQLAKPAEFVVPPQPVRRPGAHA